MKFVKRSKLRLAGGKIYFYWKRQIDWRFSGKKYARPTSPGQEAGGGTIFSIPLIRHETPLIRPLPKLELHLQHNKIINLQAAVRKLNRLIIQPGEYFSFWLLLGKPTRSKGYREGFVLHDGRVEPGIGGGLCQLTNLIYWMALHTPLTVVERWRHSHDVFPDVNRTLPFGSGATCAYPSLDLQLKNNTNQPFQLCLEVGDTHLQGEWRGTNPLACRYEVYEAYHEITSDFAGRYIRHNILRRRVFGAENRVIADEFVAENRALMMYPPLLAENLRPQ
jgi:vancomycin resistance protein VanW